MTTPGASPGASPLDDIAASANDLSAFLTDIGLSPSPIKQRRTRALALPKGPSPAPALRKLHLPENSVESLCNIYDKNIATMRQATLDEHKALAVSSPKALPQIAPVLKQHFTSTARSMCASVVQSATDAISFLAQQDPEKAPIKRPAFNKAFVPVFEYIFSRHGGHTPSSREKKFLAKVTNMTLRQIDVWFQNRRARTKRKESTGKSIAPAPTLSEALSTLKSLMEAQKGQKPKKYKQVVFKRKVTVIVEDEDEIEELNFRDMEELKLLRQYEVGIRPGIDDFDEPYWAYPEHYEPDRFEAIDFLPIRWQRIPIAPNSAPNSAPLAPPPMPINENDIASLCSQFADLKVTLTETIIEKRKVKYLLPLPPTLAAAIAKGKRRREERKAAEAATEADMQEEEQPQVQIDIQTAAEPQDQIVPELCEDMDILWLGPDCNSDNASQSDTDDSATDRQETGSEETDSEDDTPEFNPLNSGPSFESVASSLPLYTPPTDIMDLPIILDEFETGCEAGVEVYSPVINAIPDPLTLDEQLPKDPAVLNQIVKMTLDELGIPYPANIDAPYIHTIRPTFAPNPADIHFSHIYEAAKLYDDQFPLPEDYHFQPFPEDYFKHHGHSAEFPGDPIMDLIHDQDLKDPEPEHTLLSDLQAAFPSMIFTEAEAPPGWYPEPSATNPDDPSDIALDARRSVPKDIIPYIVARERDPPKPWAIDEFIMQHPLLMEEFGYGEPDWNEPGWLDHLYDRDRHVVEIASQFCYPEPQSKSEPQPRPRRRHRRKKAAEPKPMETVPEPPAVAEPEVDYISLPLPEPEPLPDNDSSGGWFNTIRDFLSSMVDQTVTLQEISMLQYLNF